MWEVGLLGVWKRFKWYEDRPRNLKESILSISQRRRQGREFWALRDVNLSIARGETLGLIGNNGAGKTTLLRLVSGLMVPTRGRIARSGRVSTMMELGVGFHPDFTGRENVCTGGIILGLTRREVDDAFPRIVEFAGLEQYIDRPIRTYSTGMYMRLAFSLAIHVNPQLLLIDEVLTVGDQSFQKKCIDRLYQFKEEGKTIVLVSHDLSMVGNLCDRVCWLEGGRLRQVGETDEVVETYLAAIQGNGSALAKPSLGRAVNAAGQLAFGLNRWGSQEVEIASVTLHDTKGARRRLFEAGQGMTLEIGYRRRSNVREAVFQLAFCREDGTRCFDVNTWADGVPIRGLDDDGRVRLSIDRIDLSAGTYTIDVGVYSPDWAQIYDFHWQSYSFDVFSPSRHEWVSHL
ncbi:MAG: ABC transporter ATP-binding protein [Chloroflexi bacterium]|nr:ABC transporter ATP-binding protein [Chloroflexota bacterium]